MPVIESKTRTVCVSGAEIHSARLGSDDVLSWSFGATERELEPFGDRTMPLLISTKSKLGSRRTEVTASRRTIILGLFGDTIDNPNG